MGDQKIKITIGFDQRESVAYHVFCQSIIQNTSVPIEITPLAIKNLSDYHENHADGSNDFIYSRFLTPYLNAFNGWAIFADGDMVCMADLKELWDLRDPSKAVQVVKHDYQTKKEVKYLGNKNENYPRKNWSSLILWNCAHPKHKILTPEFISKQSGKYLHRFTWLDDDEIGELPKEWNWLAIEYPANEKAKIIHYTLGTPCFKEYKDSSMAEYWHGTLNQSLHGIENDQ